MPDFSIDRRGLLIGAAAAPVAAQEPASAQPPPGRDPSGAAPSADQQRRMKWWHDAKFGMFIHFGLYAAHGRHEWAMENEAIPVTEYQNFTAGFNPAPGSARGWARLAKAAA
jgi:alpha-L-fucosidase